MTMTVARTRAALAIILLTSSVALAQQGRVDIEPSSPPSSSFSSFPPNFRVARALQHYGMETKSLLVKSMAAGGFDIDEETAEYDESYLDFATRAIRGEMDRIGKIRDGLIARKKRQMEEEEASRRNGGGTAEGGGTCSDVDGDGSCVDRASTTKNRTTGNIDDDDFEHFQPTELSPGQVDLLRWEADGTIVQEYGARVGLPPNLIPTLIEYVRDMGLLDIMTNMLYDDPLPPDGARWFSFQSPYQRRAMGGDDGNLRNFTWNVERPAKKWKSDMHWFNTADELSHEDALRALAKGGFDDVLRGIGETFDLDELHVDSFGFVAVTECERGFMHTDWDDVDGRAFNFLVGISSPEDAGPELVVANGDGRRGETFYGTNAGVLVGDGTMHGTRECNHRASRGVRITASIYLADVTRDNLSILAGDTTSIFPPMEEVGEEWIWSQRGRHWRKGEDGGGPGLVGDLGRSKFPFEDKATGCAWDDCENEGDNPRNACLKTCRVFMDDESEYMPGKARREVMGY
ncbi:hypothetical protein ACHAXA_008772 [Cyclostephanos tholiformis]|uniref:Uncharacterized protein n=1 Tax=Cyclostephanos tholiformis TaxID=382380 RepID=A0ABD3REZ8_9STRA